MYIVYWLNVVYQYELWGISVKNVVYSIMVSSISVIWIVFVYYCLLIRLEQEFLQKSQCCRLMVCYIGSQFYVVQLVVVKMVSVYVWIYYGWKFSSFSWLMMFCLCSYQLRVKNGSRLSVWESEKVLLMLGRYLDLIEMIMVYSSGQCSSVRQGRMSWKMLRVSRNYSVQLGWVKLGVVFFLMSYFVRVYSVLKIMQGRMMLVMICVIWVCVGELDFEKYLEMIVNVGMWKVYSVRQNVNVMFELQMRCWIVWLRIISMMYVQWVLFQKGMCCCLC